MDNINYKERYKKYKLKYLKLKKDNSNKIKGGYIEHATSFITDNTKMLFSSIGLVPLLLISGVGIIGIITIIYVVNKLINYNSKTVSEQDSKYIESVIQDREDIKDIETKLENFKTRFKTHLDSIENMRYTLSNYQIKNIVYKCMIKCTEGDKYKEILADLRCIHRFYKRHVDGSVSDVLLQPVKYRLLIIEYHNEIIDNLLYRINNIYMSINENRPGYKSITLDRYILILNIYKQRLNNSHQELSLNVSQNTILSNSDETNSFEQSEPYPGEVHQIIGIPKIEDIKHLIDFKKDTTFSISGNGISKHRWIDIPTDGNTYSVGMTFEESDNLLWLVESIYYLLQNNSELSKLKIYIQYAHALINTDLLQKSRDNNSFLNKQLGLLEKHIPEIYMDVLGKFSDKSNTSAFFIEHIKQKKLKKYYIKDIIEKLNTHIKNLNKAQNDEKLTATKQAIATEQAIEALNLPTEKRDQEDVQISDFMPCYGSSIEQTKLDELHSAYLVKQETAYRNIDYYINKAIVRFNQIYNPQQNTNVSERDYPDYLDYEYFLLMNMDHDSRNKIIINMDKEKKMMMWLTFLHHDMLIALYYDTHINILNIFLSAHADIPGLHDINKFIKALDKEKQAKYFISSSDTKPLNIPDQDLDVMFNIASITIEDVGKMKSQSSVRECIEKGKKGSMIAHCYTDNNIKEISDKGIQFKQTTEQEPLDKYQKGIIFWIMNNMYTSLGKSCKLYLHHNFNPAAHITNPTERVTRCSTPGLNCIEFTNLFKYDPQYLLEEIIERTLKIYGISNELIKTYKTDVIDVINNSDSLQDDLLSEKCRWRTQILYNTN